MQDFKISRFQDSRLQEPRLISRYFFSPISISLLTVLQFLDVQVSFSFFSKKLLVSFVLAEPVGQYRYIFLSMILNLSIASLKVCNLFVNSSFGLFAIKTTWSFVVSMLGSSRNGLSFFVLMNSSKDRTITGTSNPQFLRITSFMLVSNISGLVILLLKTMLPLCIYVWMFWLSYKEYSKM